MFQYGLVEKFILPLEVWDRSDGRYDHDRPYADGIAIEQSFPDEGRTLWGWFLHEFPHGQKDHCGVHEDHTKKEGKRLQHVAIQEWIHLRLIQRSS
jgi:hypothetical protein